MAQTSFSRFDDRVKEEVRSRADIATIISRHVALKPAGQNLKGLCPFHKEKTPSFTVNPSRGFFYCFGCGKGGDVFTFLTEIEGLSFPEALRKLAHETGVKLPEVNVKAPVSIMGQHPTLSKIELIRIHAMAAKYFYDRMRESDRAKEYLKARGLKGETVKEFLIGYAPPGWLNLITHLREKGIPASAVLACGLARTKGENASPYDQFNDRIIFPIFDLSNQIIAFGGRALEKDAIPKYLNSPETALYHKSRTLYGLNRTRDRIREENCALIVEGYMDFLALYQAGFRNVVATCGTSLTADHAQILRRFATRAVLVFDGDVAGQAAAERGATVLIPQGLEVRILLLPRNEDPDSYIFHHGHDSFHRLLQEAVDAYQFLIDRAVAQNNPHTAAGKSAIVTRLLPTIQSTSDQIIRHELIRELAERLSVREDSIYGELKKHIIKPKDTSRAGETKNYLFTLEGRIIHLLFQRPDLADYATQSLCVEAFRDPISAELFSTIIAARESGMNLDEAITDSHNDEIKRIASLMAVSTTYDGENHEEELQHLLRQLERRYLKHQLTMVRKRMGGAIDRRSELIQQHKNLTRRLAELGKNR